MKLCVFTAIIGARTDTLKEPRHINPEVDYLCFTDQPLQSRHWRIIPVAADGDACIQSRRIKIAAVEVWDEYDGSMWLDAAFELYMDPIPIAARWLYRADILALRHPHRTRIDAEAAEIIRLRKAPADRVQSQLRAYGSFVAKQQAITSTGLCVRRHAPRVQAFCKTWWKEFSKYGHCRDQMSVDYAASLAGVDVEYLEGHYRKNPYARWYKH